MDWSSENEKDARDNVLFELGYHRRIYRNDGGQLVGHFEVRAEVTESTSQD
jgi:hypothetical protein